jgi:hypothetical protein
MMDQGMIHRNAARAAGRYKRKCWWADYGDLYQAASLAQVEAWDKFDESWGRPREAYLWRAAFLAARTTVHKASSPVSTSHRTENLLGLYRESLETPHPALEDAMSAEDLCSLYERARRVRARVATLLGDDAVGFALGVITDEWKPREVAQANGCTAQRVYAAQQRMVRVLSCDRELYELWRTG